MPTIKKGERILVEWLDATHYKDVRNPDSLHLQLMETEGTLLRRTQELIVVAQTRVPPDDDEPQVRWRDVEVIPTCCVKSVRRA